MALPNDNTITLGAVATEFGVATEFKACCTAAGLDANVSTLKSFQGLSAAPAASHSMLVGFNGTALGLYGSTIGSITPTSITTPVGVGSINNLFSKKQGSGESQTTVVDMNLGGLPDTSSLASTTVVVDFVGSGLTPVLLTVVGTGTNYLFAQSGDRPDVETYLMNNYNSNVDVDIQFV